MQEDLYRLRTCEEHHLSNRSRPCLPSDRALHLASGIIDKEAYAGDVALASLFLNGRHGDVVDDLSRRMQDASDRPRLRAGRRLP